MRIRKGFTFVELIIAIFLFSYGIISVMQVFPVNRKLLAQSALQTQASFLAEEQMENVQAVDYDDLTVGAYEARAFLPSGNGTFATGFERSTDVSLIDSTYASTATDVGLKKVVITVYWVDGNVNRTYVLTSYVNNL
jgi:prepilin-type N-terminal cleavage/methylation domain-containing protein